MCLQHLRQRGFNQAFDALLNDASIQLKEPDFAELREYVSTKCGYFYMEFI
jgi:hypothetical protein